MGLALMTFATACTSVGGHDTAAREAIDYGPPATLRLCIYRDPKVTPLESAAVVNAIHDELSPYGIAVTVPWERERERPGFAAPAIIDAVEGEPQAPECDRTLWLIGRGLADRLWGLALPEVLGAVPTLGDPRFYVVAQVGSLNQTLGGGSPGAIARHEVYHTFGCAHSTSLRECYMLVAKAKGLRLIADMVE